MTKVKVWVLELGFHSFIPQAHRGIQAQVVQGSLAVILPTGIEEEKAKAMNTSLAERPVSLICNAEGLRGEDSG